MVKKIFTLIILWASLFMPIFGVSIQLPGTATYNSDKSDLNIQQWKTQIDYNDSDQAEQWLYNTVSFFNSSLGGLLLLFVLELLFLVDFV